MRPAIKAGCKVRVEPVNCDEIKLGDIIIFEVADNFVIHRIIGKFVNDREMHFLQKGDNSFGGGVIFFKQIIGRVKEVKDAAGLKIDERMWGQSNVDYFYNRLFCAIYSLLWKTKRSIFGCEPID